MILFRPYVIILILLTLSFALSLNGSLKAQDSGSIAELEALARDINQLNVQKKNDEKQLTDINTQIDILSLRNKASSRRVQQLDQEINRLGIELLEVKERLIALFSALQRLNHKTPPPMIAPTKQTLRTIRASIILGDQFRNTQTIALRKRTLLEQLRDTRTLDAQAADNQNTTLGTLRTQQEALSEAVSNLGNAINTQTQLYWQKHASLKQSDPYPLPEQAGLAEDTLNHFSNQSLVDNIVFDERKNSLPLPADGLILKRYNDAMKHGRKSQGFIVATQKGAIITAPADARVIFAQTFRNYRHIIVLAFDEHYSLTIAGLGESFVSRGNWVLSGQPLGKMTTQAAAIVGQLATRSAQPLYYIELKKDGQSLDPNPWLLSNLR